MDGGRVFAAGFAWLLAIIFLASAASRLRLAAGIIRLERGDRPQLLGPTVRAFLLGMVAVVGIQFLFVGSAYPWLHCSAFADITGALLIGLAPLMLAYLIVAALASLLAGSPENDTCINFTQLTISACNKRQYIISSGFARAAVLISPGLSLRASHLFFRRRVPENGPLKAAVIGAGAFGRHHATKYQPWR